LRGKAGKMSKKIFCVILFTLLVFSSFAFHAQESSISYKYLIANAAYDPLTVIANITLGKTPYCIATNDETNRVYVGVEDGLIVINGETDQVIAEIPLGDKVVALAVNPLTNRIYAGIYGSYGRRGNLTVIDGATNLKVGEILEHPSNPWMLAVNPVTNLVYIAYPTGVASEPDSVRVYNGENFQFVTSVSLGYSRYFQDVGVTVNPNTNKVYAMYESSLIMIDGNTHVVTKRISTYNNEMLMVNSYTNYVYVGNIFAYNGETLEEVTPQLWDTEALAIDSIHNFLYTVSDYGTLSRLNGSTHDLIGYGLALNWKFSATLDQIAVNPQTSKIYITDWSGQTYVVNAALLEATPSPTPSLPREVIYAAVGAIVIVTIAVAVIVVKKRQKK
jgi:DNA-binding beta-propeller fold protein YncE